MEPFKLFSTSPGNFSLILDAGSSKSANTISESGHEPNGYFWEGIAELITKDNSFGAYSFDPEAGMFCAYGKDENALKLLGEVMAKLANDPEAIKAMILKAKASGFVFDD